MSRQKILLDTDIGDDIDDALALALICASPELELVGVATVFGNVAARARQARTVLQLAGAEFRDIPVAAGCGAPLASRPMSYRGTEGYLSDRVPGQDSTCLPEAELAPMDARHGVQLLIDEVMRGDSDVIPVMIGAMTNLAVTLTMERKIAARIPKLTVMAGEFKGNFAEWNIRCDPEAAALVFSSGIPIDVVPYAVGADASFTAEHVARLAAGGSPMAKYLTETLTCWQNGNERRPMLFDPLAVMTVFRPDLVEWRRGTVRVELQGEATYGYTTFTEDADGPHNVAWDVDAEAALEFYLERVSVG